MTRYEQGFMTKCAEAGLDENQAVALYKFAQQYGAGIADMGRDIVDSFRKGGIGRVSNRQQSFNKEYANSSFLRRLRQHLVHPIRSLNASTAAGLGVLGAGATPAAKA